MKITYDSKIDALSIVLKTGEVSRTVEIAPEVFMDLDNKGNPLYIEVVGASEKIGKKNFSNINIFGKTIRLPNFATA
ncbi:MAG: DUF2283 domain-containing protein [Patescibacteria group bacterium]